MTTINGSGGNDTLSGTSKADVITAGDGNDRIDAGSGSDLVDGGAGNDRIDAGSGNDTVYGGDGKDDIDGGDGNDTVYGGDGNDDIEGGSGNDYLSGGSGNDELEGDSGNDVLIGAAGADWLEGGSGNDAFTYLSASDSNSYAWDRIMDFAHGRDKIDLSALLDKDDLAWGGHSAMEYGAWYLNSGSSTFVYADTDGDGESDLQIELKNTSGLTLTSRDFIGVSNKPVADHDTTTTDEDHGTVIDVLANDQGPANDGQNDFHDHDHDDDDDDDDDDHDDDEHHDDETHADQIFLTSVDASGTLGQVTQNDDGTLTYDPTGQFEYLAEGETATDTFTYTITDSQGGTDTATVTVTVTGVNDLVSFTGGDASGAVTEDDPNPMLSDSGTFTFADVDLSDTHSATVTKESGAVGGTLNALVTDNGNGTGTVDWTYEVVNANVQNLAQDEETSESFTIMVADGHGSFDTELVTLTLTGVNDAPVIGGGDSANVSVDEHTTAVLDVTAIDVDNGHELTFSIIGGADEAKFSINQETGVLTFNDAPDFESLNDEDGNNTYDVTVQVSDEHGAKDEQSIAVTVTDINEQPNTGDDFAVSVAESVADTVVLADVNATDPDLGGGNDAANDFEDLTYSITDGNGAGLIVINPAGQISLADGQMLDFEAAQQHVLTVRATDGPGRYDEALITLGVLDVNEQPDAGANFAVSAAESVADTVVLANVNATDPDLGGNNDADNNFEDLTYSITGGNGAGLFEINSANGEISLAAGQMLDFETDPQHVLTVQATDGPGLVDETQVTINVTINHPPVAVADIVITNTDLGDSFNIPEWALLANDSDPDGNPIDVQDVFAAVDGTATHTAGTGTNGFVRFFDGDPNAGGSFSYRATDGLAIGAPAIVNVYQDQLGALNGTEGNDILVAGPFSGPTTLVGIGGNDILLGGPANDTLNGNNGNDTLAGGGGNDDLAGGAGNDVFDYNALTDRGTTGDVISGFQTGSDDLDLHDLLSSIGAPHDSTAFGSYLQFIDGAGSGTSTLVQVDSDGTGGANSFQTLATLDGVAASSIDADDFIL